MLATIAASAGGGIAVLFLLWIGFVVLFIAGFWKTFTKAGEAGWKSIIPIYNLYVLLKIVGRPGWWLVLYIIPFVSLVIVIIVFLDLAHSFDKSTAFAIGLIFLSPIFIMILGFGDARYVGPSAATPAATYGYAPPPPPPPPPPV